MKPRRQQRSRLQGIYEHKESRFEEGLQKLPKEFYQLTAGTSEAGTLGPGLEKLWKEFYQVAAEKGVVLQKVMALNLEQKVEHTTFAKLRESMLNTVTSPELKSDYLEMVADLESKVPSAVEWSFPPVQVADLLQRVFPHWEMAKLVSIVGVMMSCKSSTSTPSKQIFMLLCIIFSMFMLMV